ncbi:MAG: hypothetical protein ACOX9E_10350 [Lentisphaeria bacterium]|jgi:hypothetical protein
MTGFNERPTQILDKYPIISPVIVIGLLKRLSALCWNSSRKITNLSISKIYLRDFRPATHHAYRKRKSAARLFAGSLGSSYCRVTSSTVQPDPPVVQAMLSAHCWPTSHETSRGDDRLDNFEARLDSQMTRAM